MNSNWSAVDGLWMWCVLASTFVVGFHGSEMSQSWPSPAHEASAVLCSKNWTSWQAWKPGLNVVSSLSAFSLSSNLNSPRRRRDSMIEIPSCAAAQARKSAAGVGAVMPLPSG